MSVIKIANIPVTVSADTTLNSCHEVIRDRDHDVADFTEEQIGSELKSQEVVKVKRFTTKKVTTS